jgi:signal peptidase I
MPGERPGGAAAIARRIRTRGSVCVRAYGASMYPWICSGDLLLVRRCGFDHVRSGNVILFERASRLIAHRVLYARPGAAIIITKGDSLDEADAPVSRTEFLGRITRVHHGGRELDMESLAQNLAGCFLAQISPASFLFYRPLRLARRLFLI